MSNVMATESTSNAYDWSQFELRMDVRTTTADAFKAWATGGGMASFFTRTFTFHDADGNERASGEIAQVGDAYECEFHHPSKLTGKVLESDLSRRRFGFSFGPVMRVDIVVDAHGDMTRVALRQSNIPTDEAGRVSSHMNCRSCWIYYLMNLKSVLEHGHDLRDDGLPDNVVSVHYPETVPVEFD